MEKVAPKPKPTSREWRVWSVDAHHTAQRVTRDRDMANDIAQEALLLLMRCYAQVRDLHSWLLVVLRRMAVKSASRSRRPAPRAAPKDPTCRMDGPAPFVDIDTGLDVEKAMLEMPRQQRRILALAFAGHSHAEIAAALGCEIHQVGPRLQHAYRALGRRLGLDGASPFHP